MGIYQVLCHKVEDLFVKALSKKQDPIAIKEKVQHYRSEKEEIRKQRKLENDKRAAEQRRIQAQKREEQDRQRRIQEEMEKREMESLISNVLENGSRNLTTYEYNEFKKNKQFFLSLAQQVLEPNEKALTFIFCEFDKSSKKEIKGYLIPTNKRVLFLTKNLNFMNKFRYQTIINVNWFKDGFSERGLRVQYGKRRLEFDEMFDQEQMKKVGNIILNKSTTRAI